MKTENETSEEIKNETSVEENAQTEAKTKKTTTRKPRTAKTSSVEAATSASDKSSVAENKTENTKSENIAQHGKAKKKPMTKIARRILVVAIVVAVIVVLALIPSHKTKGGKRNAAQEEVVHLVKTMEVQTQNLQEYLSLNGNVQSNNTISVYPQITGTGKILNTFVTLGSSVRKGEKIAEVDPSVPGSVYSASPVYAPISGYITSLPLTVGTFVTAQTAIAKIGDIKDLQVRTQVPERDIGVLKIGQSADITLIAYPNEVFTARTIKISPIVDEVSRSKEIYLGFDKDDERVNAGMYVKIKLYTRMHENVIVIPFSVIVSVDNNYYVFVAKDDSTVEQRKVEVGTNVDGNVIILSGLDAGERIATTSIQILEDGSKIKDADASNENEGTSSSNDETPEKVEETN